MTQATQTPPATSDIQPLPAPPAERDPPDGSLVPVRARADGWTAEKQQAFIAHLGDHGSVKAACAHVGMSEQSAYQLRRRADAAAFRAAWGEAVRIDVERVAETLVDRALNGDLRQRWYKDELIGEERVYSDRLQTWLVQNGMTVLDRLDAARARDGGFAEFAAVPPAPKLRVWRDDVGMQRTNAVAPPEWAARELDAHGRYGEPHFSRLLTPDEQYAWARRPEAQAIGNSAEQARLSLFAIEEQD